MRFHLTERFVSSLKGKEGRSPIFRDDELVGFGVQAACEDDPWLNILQYVVPMAAMWWGMSQIFRQKVSRRRAAKLAKASPALTGAA